MSVPPEVTEVLRRWVRKAEHDLEAARLILAGESHCPYDTACFHCHQAAEKYLKALLTLLGIQAPRTHDLGNVGAFAPRVSTLSTGGTGWSRNAKRRRGPLNSLRESERKREASSRLKCCFDAGGQRASRLSAISSSFRTVFQFLPVQGVCSILSTDAHGTFGRAMPLG